MNLEPVFDFANGASSFLLHQGQAEICIDQNTYVGDGEVRLDLMPQAKIHLYGCFQNVLPQDVLSARLRQEGISSFSLNGHQIEGFSLGGGEHPNIEECKVKWCPNSEPLIGVGEESTQMQQLVFHLFNFVNFNGTRWSTEQSGTTMHRIEYIDLISNGWKVELKSLISTQENIEVLRKDGGYRLTHIGSIQKVDDTQFSGKDAQECLYALRFFLSFAKGGWCEPICAVGFDASGQRVWESWSSPRDPWHSSPSWFDPHNGSQLTNLFPGFMMRWMNDGWRETLREVIYWYLNANHSPRGIDAGIILTQAAIDRMSYEIAVKDKHLVSVEGFKNLWASDKFRLLFSSLEIPLDIPPQTPELQKLACKGQMNWLDAPHALTEVRNSLIHPEHKKRGQLSATYYEAWNLGLWYLEMGLLAICWFSGTYGNRLKQRWVGQVEDVPWKE